MGFFDGIKQMLGAKPTPPVWEAVEDSELARLWRSRDALPTRHRFAIRDAMLKRLLPLPMAEVSNPYGPVSTATVGDVDAETLIALCARLHPSSRPAALSDGVIVGRSGFGVRCGEENYLLVVFPSWRPDLASDALLPHLPSGANVEVVITPCESTAAQLGELGHRVVGWPSPGKTLEVGELVVVVESDAPDTLRVDNDETGFSLAAGLQLSTSLLLEEPTYLIGSFAMTEAEDFDGLVADGWEASDAGAFDMIALLTDARGSEGRVSSELLRLLGIPVLVTGDGVSLSAEAQGLVAACLSGEMDVESLSRSTPALEEAFRWCVVEGDLDSAARLANSMAGDAAQSYHRAVIAELRADIDQAVEAFRAVSGDERLEALASAELAFIATKDTQHDERIDLTRRALDTLVGHPIVGANLVLAACKAEQAGVATEALEETQHAGRSWLGAMLDGVVHADEQADTTPRLLSVAGARLAPLGEALSALRAGRFEHGELLLRRVEELCPTLPAASGQLALHLCSTERFEEAKVVCLRGLEENPHHLYLKALLAEVYMAEGAFEDAALALRTLLEASDDVEDWWVNLVLCEVALGHEAEVKHLLDSLEANKADMTLLALLRSSVREAFKR